MKKNTIKFITYAAVFAASLVVARMFAVLYLKNTTPLGKLLKATKEIQFYVIPAFTLFAVNKLGKKQGWMVSLSGVIIAFAISLMTQSIVIFGPISVVFDYFVPWIIFTLIAFVPEDSKIKTILMTWLLWFAVSISWAISGVWHWKLTPFSASLKWNTFAFFGWMMYIILPALVLFLQSKFINKK